MFSTSGCRISTICMHCACRLQAGREHYVCCNNILIIPLSTPGGGCPRCQCLYCYRAAGRVDSGHWTQRVSSQGSCTQHHHNNNTRRRAELHCWNQQHVEFSSINNSPQSCSWSLQCWLCRAAAVRGQRTNGGGNCAADGGVTGWSSAGWELELATNLREVFIVQRRPLLELSKLRIY